MAKTGFQVDFDGSFKRALLRLAEKHQVTSAKIVNQTLLDIAERCFETTPLVTGAKDSILDSRKLIRKGLNKKVIPQEKITLSDRLETAKAFLTNKKFRKLFLKNRNKPRKYKGKKPSLVNLIINARLGRQGKKGVSGQAMKTASAKLIGYRTGAVGSLRIVFLPVIRKLMRYAKFKFSWSKKAKGIKRIPGYESWGAIVQAVKSKSPVATFIVNRTSKSSKMNRAAKGILSSVIAKAIKWKRGKVLETAEKLFREDLAAFNRAK